MKTRKEIFNDGIQIGYNRGFERGYQQALDDLRREFRESSATLRYEVLRNGETVMSGNVTNGEEDDG